MFDPATLQLIKKIDVGKGPDGIYYDPKTKRVFTNNHGSHDITAIDARTGDVVGTVKVEGDGEEAVIADDLIYVNSENTNEVVVFDPKSLAIKNRFPIGVAQTPTGLAYDAKTKRLFIGCRNEPKMVVMDATSGKVITSFPIGRGVDYASFVTRNRPMNTKMPAPSRRNRAPRPWPSILKQRKFFSAPPNTLRLQQRLPAAGLSAPSNQGPSLCW